MKRAQPKHYLPARLATLAAAALVAGLLMLAPLGAPTTRAQAGAAPFELLWNADQIAESEAAAWGDLDGDGDLDLAIGNNTEPPQLYLNDGRGNLSLDPRWNPGPMITYGLAWGDLDGDGDLDLVLGNFDSDPGNADDPPSQLYRNDGQGGLTRDASWAPGDATTRAVALGDVDNDGDLDLVLGNEGQPSQLYRNDGQGGLTRDASWIADAATTRAVALGDSDNDGDLDLVLGNEGQPSLLYLNRCPPTPASCGAPAGGIFAAPVALGSATTTALAFGDYDRDGDLDLAVGNQGTPSQLYTNRCTPATGGCSFPAGGRFSSAQITYTTDGSNTLTVGQTLSVAWGDYDGDGYLDLLFGRAQQLSLLLRNRPVNPLNPAAGRALSALAWASPSAATTPAAPWADVDGDGDLDLALANKSQSSQIYRNTGGHFAALPDLGQSRAVAVAWGDVDGDGDLDLALANDGDQASQIYLNRGVSGFGLAEWAPATGAATALAWADVDNDGDLDLALAFNGAPTRIYRNSCNGACAADTLSLDAAPLWAGSDQPTRALAFGDVDNDGDLDLALGNENNLGTAPSRLYRNDCNPNAAGSCTGTASFSPGQALGDGALRSFALAFGDVDNDGDLDLALGNNNAANLLFRNEPTGTLSPDPAAWTTGAGRTTSLAWGDLEGDGDLDLLVGGEDQQLQIYRNEQTGGATRLVRRRDLVPPQTNTRGLALGDLDNDGDLDLVLANDRDQASQVYLNDGDGRLGLAPWDAQPDPAQPDAAPSYGVALGDLDRDGDLDLAFANLYQSIQGEPQASVASRIYRNQAAGSREPSGAALTLSVERPFTAAAGGLSAGRVIDSPTIDLTFTLRGQPGAHVGSLRAFYSLDGGSSGFAAPDRSGGWRPARPAAGSNIVDITLGADGSFTGTFRWDTFGSAFFGQSDTVALMLRAYPTNRSEDVGAAAGGLASGAVAGPFQRPYAGASTSLFRVRGTQVRVQDDAANPVQGAVVYRLAAGASSGGRALADATGRPFTTDAQGYLRGRGDLRSNDLIAALRQIRQGDQFTSKYRLFQTSPIARTTGKPEQAVSSGGGVQLLTVSASRPLLLFDLSVGLEWDVRSDPAYLERLESDLRRASELIYDWSDGQAALGSMRVTSDLPSFVAADIQIDANNRRRPRASQGGIINSVRVDPQRGEHIYTAGSVAMGAVWNRYGQANGTIGADWPAALAHELGHLAFYLDDNYLGRRLSASAGAPADLIGLTSCKGAMSDPYTSDNSEFHPRDTGWTAGCLETLSEVETGRADWQTIELFYPELNQTSSYNQHPGPAAQALDFTQISMPAPAASGTPRPLSAPIFPLVQQVAGQSQRYFYGPGTRARAMLFARQPDGTARVIDLGRPTSDSVLARGARPGDRVCLYDLPAFLAGCVLVGETPTPIQLSSLPGWRPDLTITPVGAAATFALTLPQAGLVLPNDPATRFSADVYAHTRGAPISVPLSDPNGTGLYRGVVTLDPQATGGYVQIKALSATGAVLREAITEFYVVTPPLVASGAGAPACCPDKPPAPVAASWDGNMLLFSDPLVGEQYYSMQTATSLPPAPPWSIVVGQGYRLVSNMSQATLRAKEAAINAGYSESELPPGTEGGLALHFYDPALGRWERLASSRVDPERNELAALVRGPGFYALMTTLPVEQGWNIFAYPWAQKRTVAAAAAELNIDRRHFTTIYSYLLSDPVNPWRVYDIDAPAWVNNLGELEYGRGYWINVTDTGAQPAAPARQALSTALPVPPMTIYGAVGAGSGYTPVAGDTVLALVGEAVCGRATLESRPLDGVTRPTFVVHIRAASNAEPGCGAPGRAVQLQFSRPSDLSATTFWSGPWDNGRPLRSDRQLLYLPLLRR